MGFVVKLWRKYPNWKSQNYLQCAGGEAGARVEGDARGETGARVEGDAGGETGARVEAGAEGKQVLEAKSVSKIMNVTLEFGIR